MHIKALLLLVGQIVAGLVVFSAALPAKALVGPTSEPEVYSMMRLTPLQRADFESKLAYHLSIYIPSINGFLRDVLAASLIQPKPPEDVILQDLALSPGKNIRTLIEQQDPGGFINTEWESYRTAQTITELRDEAKAAQRILKDLRAKEAGNLAIDLDKWVEVFSDCHEFEGEQCLIIPSITRGDGCTLVAALEDGKFTVYEACD